MGTGCVEVCNVCMKDFLDRPQEPSYVMSIVFVLDTSTVRPERKCWR